MKEDNENLGGVYVVLSAVLFGCMPLLAKIAYMHGSNAYTTAFGRFLFGFIFLLAIIRFKGDTVRISKEELLEIVKFSVPYALMPIFLYRSYDFIDSGLATTLHFTYPVVVILFLSLFYRKPMKRKQIFCTVICMIGILLMYNPNGQVELAGIVLAAFSGVLYAIYIVFLGNSLVKRMSPFILSFWLAVFSTAEIGVIALCSGKLTFQIGFCGWGAEIVLALLTSVCALVLFQKGVLLCGEVKASLLSTFEPLTGLIIGLAVFREAISIKQLAGIFCILIAVLLLVLVPANKD